MTDLKPNADLAYRVLDYIEAHPEQHNQATFIFGYGNLPVLSKDNAPCGTTACFAGWTVLLTGHQIVVKNPVTTRVRRGNTLVPIDEFAADLLGIDMRALEGGGAYDLFYEAASLEEVRDDIERLFGPRPQAAHAGSEDY